MLKREDSDSLDWRKMDGRLPAIVQDVETRQVLMLGYVTREALEKTCEEGRVTFFSRSKDRLWTKGETSGNHLDLVAVEADCDRDALLFLVRPHGPTCHEGSTSCFEAGTAPGLGFLAHLGRVVADRHRTLPDASYTADLFRSGLRRIAQKVGEEGVEVALAGVWEDDEADDALLDESADLLFHLLVLLEARGKTIFDLTERLRSRHGK